MDVVERYLENVRAYLPRGRQDDVVAELREDIRSGIEDREEKLGRSLFEEERIAILRAHGHPILVAGRHRADGGRLVIGREVVRPALYPFFGLAILAVAAITVLVLGFGSLPWTAGVGRPYPVFRTAVYLLALQVGVVVAAFAILEAWLRRSASTWDPRRLPRKGRPPRTEATLRVGASFQLVATVIFVWIWVAVPNPLSVLGPAAADLRPGPAWRFLHLGVLVSTLLSLVTPALTLVLPSWHRFRWLVSLFSTGAFIAFTAAGFWSGPWIVPAASYPEPASLEALGRTNALFTICLAVALFLGALGTVIDVVRGAWRELRRAPPSPA